MDRHSAHSRSAASAAAAELLLRRCGASRGGGVPGPGKEGARLGDGALGGGLSAYQDAVDGAFVGDVDFAQVIKAYGQRARRGQRAALQPARVHEHRKAAR